MLTVTPSARATDHISFLDTSHSDGVRDDSDSGFEPPKANPPNSFRNPHHRLAAPLGQHCLNQACKPQCRTDMAALSYTHSNKLGQDEYKNNHQYASRLDANISGEASSLPSASPVTPQVPGHYPHIARTLDLYLHKGQ